MLYLLFIILCLFFVVLFLLFIWSMFKKALYLQRNQMTDA